MADTTKDGSLGSRWKVAWMTSDGRRVVHAFGKDFAQAVKVYTAAVKAGKAGTTIISANMAFPPPEKYQRRYVRGISKTTGRLIEGEIIPLDKLNRGGIWWCPYCAKLRKFRKRSTSTYEGIVIPNPHMGCPMCDAAHTDFWVRFYNPIAKRFDGNFRDPARRRQRRR